MTSHAQCFSAAVQSSMSYRRFRFGRAAQARSRSMKPMPWHIAGLPSVRQRTDARWEQPQANRWADFSARARRGSWNSRARDSRLQGPHTLRHCPTRGPNRAPGGSCPGVGFLPRASSPKGSGQRLPSRLPSTTHRDIECPSLCLIAMMCRSYLKSGGGSGIRTHEGLHPSGFQDRRLTSARVRHSSPAFVVYSACWLFVRRRSPTFAIVRRGCRHGCRQAGAEAAAKPNLLERVTVLRLCHSFTVTRPNVIG